VFWCYVLLETGFVQIYVCVVVLVITVIIQFRVKRNKVLPSANTSYERKEFGRSRTIELTFI
jgi:hypothetical protein